MKSMMVVLVALICGLGLHAQTYTRTAQSGTYNERSGTNSSSRWLQGSPAESAGAKLVLLSTPFIYFDRRYTQVIMMRDGRAVFSDVALSFTGPYDLSTPAAAQNASIFAFGADLWQFLAEEPAVMEAYVESDRVVLQWKNMGHEGLSGCGYSQFSFQIHLLNNNDIELHYGPERLPAGWTESFTFVSGIVSPNGADRVAGFGNTLNSQTTRPTPGAIVRFVPSGFVLLPQIELRHTSYLTPAELEQGVIAGRVYMFSLRATGAGETFSGLSLSFGGGIAGTATLRHAGGVLATASLGSTINFTGFSHTLPTAAVEEFEVQVAVTSVVSSGTFFPRATSVSTSVPAVHGANFGIKCRARVGPAGRVSCSYNTIESNNIAGRRVVEFEVRSEIAGSFAMTGVTMALTTSGGLSYSDIDEVRLTRISSSGSGTMIGSQPATAIVNFTGLNEPATLAGTDYAISVYVAATFAGYGAISCALSSITTNPAVVELVQNMGNARDFDVVGLNMAQCYVSYNQLGCLTQMPAQPGETNLPGLAFIAQSTVAAPITITSLVFTTNSTGGVTNPRLYLDTGTKPGLLDAGDTGGLAYTATINAADVTFSLIGGLTATQSGTAILMVFDLTAPTPSSYSIQFELSQAANAAGNPLFRVQRTSGTPTLYGCFFSVGVGSAGAGIDLTVEQAGAVVSPLPGSGALAWRVTCAARGAGGFLPQLGFSFVRSFYGVGRGSGVRIAVYLEGTGGPTGTLDASDRMSVTMSLGPDDFTDSILIELANYQQFCLSGETRRFLICVWQSGNVFGETVMRMVYVGSGTNVRMLPGTEFPAAAVNVLLEPAPIPAPPVPPGGGDDDGGCNAQGGKGMFMLLGVLAALAAGLRLARRRHA